MSTSGTIIPFFLPDVCSQLTGISMLTCAYQIELGKAAETAKLGIFTDDAKKIANGVSTASGCNSFSFYHNGNTRSLGNDSFPP